ncbi:hypothetical protein SUDANB180_00841 [Streptomyces sp. enrichment culture]
MEVTGRRCQPDLRATRDPKEPFPVWRTEPTAALFCRPTPT